MQNNPMLRSHSARAQKFGSEPSWSLYEDEKNIKTSHVFFDLVFCVVCIAPTLILLLYTVLM